MGLIDTLVEFGFDRDSKAKMVRHKDTRSHVDWNALLKATDHFEEYQSWQGKPVFHDIDFVVSFIGVTPGCAEFWGVYRVLDSERVPYKELPEPDLWRFRDKAPHYKYQLERLVEYDTLQGRFVVEWNGERTWTQNLKNNAVLECPLAFDADDPMWSAREGELSEVLYLRKKRNRAIVEKRKQHDDYTCKACGFKLELDGKFIIDCHHLNPFQDAEERITSTRELVCLCPTCHRIAHARRPPYKLKEIRQLRGKS